ncbi:MAG: glycine zipper 2TM domain-containing protein [Casimicrobiaceae bacterium]|nr:glycine zipper 2TM domain-containing protein [Casimicrobiaceae bacterium]
MNATPHFLLRALALSLAGALAAAAAAQSFTDVAQVVSATPVYERVRGAPQQECWNETISTGRRAYRGEGGYVDASVPGAASGGGVGGGTVLGAILGGITGYQFGNSQAGRNTGAAIGAVLGGLVGHSIENSAYAESRDDRASGRVDYVPETRTVQRCRSVPGPLTERIAGYDVVYRYQGREYSTRTREHPGSTINVRVTLVPELR